MPTQSTQCFPSSAVRVRGAVFARAMEQNRDYLLRLDADRLLSLFRIEAGLAPRAEKYGGWESQGIAGHSLGHYLSALSLLFAATGNPDLKARAGYVVSELCACQEAGGDGYIGATPDGKALYARIKKGEIEHRDPFNLNGGWVPLYTLHKIFAGLFDAYHLCGNDAARGAVIRLTDWCDGVFSSLSHEQMQGVLFVEHGGMAESLAQVWDLTQNPRHLELARHFRHDALFEPALRGEDALDGRHANTQIPKFIGYQRIGELTGESNWKTAARNFWNFVARNRSFNIGGNSVSEHFFPVDKFESSMQHGVGPETCNTYNMLRLTRDLWAQKPDAALMDFYERGLWNHILASQHPETGGYVYHSGVRPGSYRTYSTETESFWCCVGTGMENPGKYGEAIYARCENKLFVNLFIDSELNWAEKGVILSQNTRFPDEPRTTLRMEAELPRDFTLAIRYPGWVENGALKIAIGGESWPVHSAPGEYIEVSRTWKSGDTVEIELPMRVSSEILPGEPGFAALFYGPLVLAARLGAQGLSEGDWTASHLPRDRLFTPFEEQPAITTSREEIAERVHLVEGESLTFQTYDLTKPTDVSLIPFYQLHNERYSLYFPVLGSESAWQERQNALAASAAREAEITRRVIDSVQPGEQQPEIDHQMRGQNTRSGRANDRGWRIAEAGGWFSYQLKTLPDAPLILGCTYWGGDIGREFDIFVDDVWVASQKLNGTSGTGFVEAITDLAPELTRNKVSVTVRWQSKNGKIAGGLFGCRILRTAMPQSQQF